MNEYKRVGINSLLIGLSSVAGGVILFPIWILLARYLGVDAYGDFAFVFSLITVFQTFADGGVVTVTIKNITKNKEKTVEILSYTYTFTWLVTALSLALITAYFKFVNPGYYLKDVIYIMFFTVLAILHGLIFTSAVRAHEKMGMIAVAGIINKVLLLSLVFIAVKMDFGIQGVAYAHLIAAATNWIIFYLYIAKNYGRLHFKADIAKWRQLSQEATPLGLGMLLRKFIVHLDTFMLTALATAFTVGLYSSAYRILQMVEIGAISLSSVIFPLMSRLAAAEPRQFAKVYKGSVRILIFISMPFAAWIFIMAPELIILFYGNQYFAAIEVLKILSLTMMFTIPSSIFHPTFAALELQGFYLSIIGVGLIINFVSNFFLIPKFGALGAAYSMLVSEFCIIMFAAFLLGRKNIYSRFLLVYARAGIATLFAAIPMWFYFSLYHKTWILIPCTLLYFLIYLGMAKLARLFSFHEVRKLSTRKKLA